MMNRFRSFFICLFAFALLLAGCSGKFHFSQEEEKVGKAPAGIDSGPAVSKSNKTADSKNQNDSSETSVIVVTTTDSRNADIQVVSEPEIIPVLVNKANKLPDHYQPSDLVFPDIPFIFEQKTPKRQMREVAAAAIEELFAGAKEQGVQLLGVSAYRSHAAQESLFNYYVNLDGYEAARKYSAVPGTSEHETGLAIDVTGGDGKCPAEECFAGSDEAKWLQRHAAEYGFIIRYPKGKESITGYTYEPWHLRFVGKKIAQNITERGITLEEYYNSIPVNN